MIYEKDGQQVGINDKFIYLSEIYQLWGWGAALLDSKYYSSDKPIKMKKGQNTLKKKGYSLCRFWELCFAPENYLINNGFKLIET